MGKSKPDGKAADKGTGGKAGKGKEKETKPKGASSINVRHILVRPPAYNSFSGGHLNDMISAKKCEKHSKKEEALAKLRDGAKFDEVARDFSEDKARQGETTCSSSPIP